MNFPAQPVAPCDSPPELLGALGVEAVFVGKSQFDYLVEVDSEEAVRNCRPDFVSLGQLSRGTIITSRAEGSRYDFVSRFFAPAVGINEDPVTGAAHCQLGPYWSAKMKKRDLVAYQASARGGEVHIRVEGDRVILGGRAVTVMHCKLV